MLAKIETMELVNTGVFEGNPVDFFKDENGLARVTAEQLGNALGYAEPRKAVGKIVERNKYIEDSEFSCVVKLTTDFGPRDTRVFTVDGIMEVSFLSRSAKARSFRSWVRAMLKDWLKGNLVNTKSVEAEVLEAQTKKLEAQKELLDGLMKAIGITEDNMKMIAKSSSKGKYSATDIAAELGTDHRRIGVIASKEHLKHPDYGQYQKRGVSRVFLYNDSGKRRIVSAYLN